MWSPYGGKRFEYPAPFMHSALHHVGPFYTDDIYGKLRTLNGSCYLIGQPLDVYT